MIITYPNQILTQVSQQIVDFSNLQLLVDEMLDVMYSGDGVGLAAPQVGKLLRLALVDPSAGSSSLALRVMINPVIERSSSEKNTLSEGCLSLPGVQVMVSRSSMIDVKYFNLDGTQQSVTLTDLEARIAQHEIDHLDGITLMKRVKGHK